MLAARDVCYLRPTGVAKRRLAHARAPQRRGTTAGKDDESARPRSGTAQDGRSQSAIALERYAERVAYELVFLRQALAIRGREGSDLKGDFGGSVRDRVLTIDHRDIHVQHVQSDTCCVG